MTSSQIREIQTKIGTTADGLWGPKSKAACLKYLRSLCPVNPWPRTDEDSLTAFYGAPGDESRLYKLPIPDGVEIRYEGQIVKGMRCHERVAPSLLQILIELSAKCPHVLLQYDGCYNHRSMRGGSRPSLHARGAAVDFMSATNGMRDEWPARADMPWDAIEVFARHGLTCAGPIWGYDAMHAQFTRF